MMIALKRLAAIDGELNPRGFGAVTSSDGNLPLHQLHYHSQLTGLSVRTTIVQTYYNPFDEAIEANYVFPIEGRQAVIGCEMRVAGRIVRARLKERGQARADYQRAIRNGHRAALVEKNRPETFSMKVGNIPPGEPVQIVIETVGLLDVEHGEWTLRLPLVVAPRYTSGLPLPFGQSGNGVHADTDQVPDASVVSPPTWLPGFASPVSLRLTVDLDMGTLASPANWKEWLQSSLHSVVLTDSTHDRSLPASTLRAAGAAETTEHGEFRNCRCRVQLQPGERINRDFILRGRIDGSQIRTSLAAERIDVPTRQKSGAPTAVSESAFAVTIVPPNLRHQAPRDIVFLLDRSGSMGGWKMHAAREGIQRLIEGLNCDDRFKLAAFDHVIDDFGVHRNGTGISGTGISGNWINATDTHRIEACRWLKAVDSQGGTELGAALMHALDAFRNADANYADDNSGRSHSIVLVTDGQVTGEDTLLRVLGTIPEHCRPRLFCLGIDEAVNAGVLQRLAEFTGGVFSLAESTSRMAQILDDFANDIGTPALTDVQIERPDGGEAWLATDQSRTLYPGRSLTVFGRTPISGVDPSNASASGIDRLSLNVTGRLPDGAMWTQSLTTVVRDSTRSVLLPLWGRENIQQLEDRLASLGRRDQELADQIVKRSLECSVLSRLTAFVAVDETERVADGTMPHSIIQPVDFPEGWAAPPSITAAQLISRSRSSESRGTHEDSMNSRPVRYRKARSADPGASFESVCVQRGIVSADQMLEAVEMAGHLGISPSQSLYRLGYAGDQDLMNVLAEISGTDIVDLEGAQIANEVISRLPESLARENRMIPTDASASLVTVAVADPTDLDLQDKIRFVLGCDVRFVAATGADIEAAVARHYGTAETESVDSMICEFTETQIDFSTGSVFDPEGGDAGPFEETEDLLAGEEICMEQAPVPFAASAAFPPQPSRATPLARRARRQPEPSNIGSAPIVRLVELLLNEAVKKKASHVMISGNPSIVQVFYVIGGKLVLRDAPPARLLSALISRFMILAGMDISIKHERQSGTIRFAGPNGEIELSTHVIYPDVLIEINSPASQSEMPDCVREWWTRHANSRRGRIVLRAQSTAVPSDSDVPSDAGTTSFELKRAISTASASPPACDEPAVSRRPHFRQHR
ncbi:MAG: VIT domain-containing protein [Planctomycetaceae bacterium]